MKKIISEFRNLLILCLLELVTGILVLIDPFGFTRTLLMIVGIVMAIFGGLFIFQYFKKTPETASQNNDLFFGLLLIIGGIFMLIKPDNIIDVFSLLTTLYGVGIIVSGLAKLQISVDQLRLKNKKWWYFLILSVITLAVGAVSYSNPFATISTNWRFTGICLILLAVADIITIILDKTDIKIKPKAVKPEEVKQDDAIDAEVTVTDITVPVSFDEIVPEEIKSEVIIDEPSDEYVEQNNQE